MHILPNKNSQKGNLRLEFTNDYIEYGHLKLSQTQCDPTSEASFQDNRDLNPDALTNLQLA